MKDLFEHPEEMPPELTAILNAHDCDADQYKELPKTQDAIEAIGFTFEWGLDADPFNLRKMTREDFVILESVGTAINPNTLIGYPVNADGTVTVDAGMATHLNDSVDDWFIQLSEADRKAVVAFPNSNVEFTHKHDHPHASCASCERRFLYEIGGFNKDGRRAYCDECYEHVMEGRCADQQDRMIYGDIEDDLYNMSESHRADVQAEQWDWLKNENQ